MILKKNFAVLYPAGTTKPPLRNSKGGFIFLASLRATLSTRLSLNSPVSDMPDFPYELARLVNADKPISKNSSERWYISFWVWDVSQGKKTRKRDYEINQYQTVKSRLDFAKVRIREINKLLVTGYISDTTAPEPVAAPAYYNPDLNIKDALEFALKIKKGENRKSTHQAANSVLLMFLEFLQGQKWNRLKASAIKQDDIKLFLDFLITRPLKPLANVTRNSYLNKLGSLFACLHERKMIAVNPCAGIAHLQTESGRNLAFSEHQIKEIKTAVLDKIPMLWDFIQFMFYGFIRPGELRQLKVLHIDLVGGQIFVPAQIAKNRKGQYVKISPRLRATLTRMDIAGRDGNEYIFSLKPGNRSMLPENFMSAAHLAILRGLKYGKDFTLYSWKHTGVVFHYRAGVDIKSLQTQLRHASLMETDIYLKSLGLFTNTEIEDKSPVI
jgi:integrase